MAARPPAQRSPTLSPAAARPRRAESGSNQRPSRRGHHAARSPPSSSSSPSDSDMDEPWEPPRAPNQHARPAPTPPTPSQARRHREKSRVDEDSDMDEPWEPPRPANQPTRDVHSPRHPPAGRRQRHRDDEDSEMDEPWEPPKPPREQQREPSAAPQPSPARRSRDIPIDPALLESDDEPYDPPTPRPPPRWPRFDPVDDALRSQGQTRSVYSVARPSPLNPKSPQASRATQSPAPPGPEQASNAEEGVGGSHSVADAEALKAARIAEAIRGVPESDSEDEDARETSPSTMTVDEPYDPSSGRLPTFNFNRERYPAYDEHARRIGLEHTRVQSAPNAGGGSYYRERTRHYPGPNVTPADFPHVMSFDLRARPSEPADAPPDEPPASGTRAKGKEPAATRGNPRGRPPKGTFPPPANAPESSRRPTQRLRTPPTGPETSSESPPNAAAGLPEDVYPDIPDPEPALRVLLGFEDGQEVSLRSLVDPPNGEKPGYPYPTLIKLAIHGSPNKRLTLQEIYAAIEERFKWFKDNADDKAWQNSIRHNLSLNKCFRKVPRPISEPGKGSFWVVDYSQGEGNKRERKRRKKPTKADLRKLAEAESERQRGHISDSPEASDPGPDRHTPTPEPPPPPPMPAPRPLVRGAPQGGLPPALWGNKKNRRSLMFLVNTPETTTIPVPGSSRNSPEIYRPGSRASTIAAQLGDAHIDPLLRDPAPETGHIVGEGRTRSSTRSSRRTASPYSPPVEVRYNTRRSRMHMSESPSPRMPYAPIPQHPANPHVFGQTAWGHMPPQAERDHPTVGWTPYDASVSANARPPRQLPGVPTSNMLGLSARTPAPEPPFASSSHASSSRHTGPPVSNARDTRGAASRAPAPLREPLRRSTRVSARRGEYTDSRGNTYPAQGRVPTSDDDSSSS